MYVTGISSLKNNLIWIICNNKNQCLIIDPSEADFLLKFLIKKKLTPVAIFLTHHHLDHTYGVEKLLSHFSIPVYGPKETKQKGTTIIVSENDSILILDTEFFIISLPGHTLDHIGYYSNPWLFCGDTIFSAGCGKIFEGTVKQMYSSLKKINTLPSNTLIFPGHDYNLINLRFASLILPEDNFIKNYKKIVRKLSLYKKLILPTILSLERKINLFLRCKEFILKKKINNKYSLKKNELLFFSILRKQRDLFKK